MNELPDDPDCGFCYDTRVTKVIKHDERGRPIELGFDGVYKRIEVPCPDCRWEDYLKSKERYQKSKND